MAVLEAYIHLVKLAAHDDQTFDGLLQLSQCAGHDLQKSVEALDLLDKDSAERLHEALIVSLEETLLAVGQVELSRQLGFQLLR